MKKTLLAVLAISFLTIVPMAVAAVEIDTTDSCTMSRVININEGKSNAISCTSGGNYSLSSSDGAMCCLMNSIYNVVDWIFIILVAVAGIFIIIGAMNIIIAGGDSAKVDTGRKYIMYAAIGLFVAFIARAIPSVVVGIVG